MFPKHNGYDFISESFAFDRYIFVTLTKKTVTSICDLEKLTKYLASVVSVVSSNPCAGPLPFLLSVCTYELLSTLKLTTFLPKPKLGYEEK